MYSLIPKTGKSGNARGGGGIRNDVTSAGSFPVEARPCVDTGRLADLRRKVVVLPARSDPRKPKAWTWE